MSVENFLHAISGKKAVIREKTPQANNPEHIKQNGRDSRRDLL